MSKLIKIEIKPKHFKNAISYSDSEKCPLALALKEHFNHDEVSVLKKYVVLLNYRKTPQSDVCDIRYKILGKWTNKTPGKMCGTNDTVDSLISKAKKKQKVGYFYIDLKKKKQ